MEMTWPGWENKELLGEGSFGKVYRIAKEEFGTTYEAALKVISIPQTNSDIQAAYAEGMDEASVTEYFKSCMEDIVAEFALMSQLKGNSNIVSYEDHMVVQHEDRIGWDILIRMELLTPLVQYITRNSLTESDVIRMGIHLSRALTLCQRRGILHRDIKPENIFLSKDGDFKLGDFGVARIAEKTISAMSRKGTYTYMAPEVYKGEEYGFSADLYSLGIVLYRFINNNRTPFLPDYPTPIQYQDRERALNDRIMGKTMPYPDKGSVELKNIVMKACAFNPAERYQSAAELENALSALKITKSSPAPSVKEVEKEEEEEKTVSAFDAVPEKAVDKKEQPIPEKKAVEEKPEKVKVQEEIPQKETTQKETTQKETAQAEPALEDIEEEKTISEISVKEYEEQETKVKERKTKKQGKKKFVLGLLHAANVLGSTILFVILFYIQGGIAHASYESMHSHFGTKAFWRNLYGKKYVPLGTLILPTIITFSVFFIVANIIHIKVFKKKLFIGDIILEVLIGLFAYILLFGLGYVMFFDWGSPLYDEVPWMSFVYSIGQPFILVGSGLIILVWSKTLRKVFMKKKENVK